jgi:hypothetical protein
MKEETMSKPSTKINSQTPAEGILLRKDYGDAKIYQIVCECGDCDHDHNIWVEAEDHGITVTIYTQQKTKWWEQNRWQTIWRLLTKGYVERESTLIMSEQQALNYANILISATKDVKKFIQDRKENSAAVKEANEQDCV